jgi:membrane protease YdiL (CAAX protease family)
MVGIFFGSALIAFVVFIPLNMVLPDAWGLPFEFLWYPLLLLLLVSAAREAGVDTRRLRGPWPSRSGVLLSLLLPIPLLLLTLLEPRIVPDLLPSELTAPNPSDKPAVAGQTKQLFILSVDLIILVPVVEEYVFRGLLLQRWSQKWGAKKSVLASSLLFGVLHDSVISTAVFGLVACALLVETRSLYGPILLHAANNGLSVILSRLQTPAFELPAATAALLFVPAAFLVIWLSWHRLCRHEWQFPFAA